MMSALRPRIPAAYYLNASISSEKAELSLFVVKKQVYVGIVAGLVTRGRAEHIEMFDA